MQLQARRAGLLGFSFAIYRGDRFLAEVHTGWVRRRGECEIEGKLFEFLREGGWRQRVYLLESRNHYHARAVPLGFFRNHFNIECGYRQLVLGRLGFFTRAFGLFEQDRLIGQIRPVGLLHRKATIEIPDDIEEAVAVFLFWIVAIKWQQDAAAG